MVADSTSARSRAARSRAWLLALVGWLGPPSKSGRLLMTLLNPACATGAIASGPSCGATLRSGLRGCTVIVMAPSFGLLGQRLLHGGRHLAHVGLAGEPR